MKAELIGGKHDGEMIDVKAVCPYLYMPVGICINSALIFDDRKPISTTSYRKERYELISTTPYPKYKLVK